MYGPFLDGYECKMANFVHEIVFFSGKSEHGIPERDLTLAEIYDTLAILILKPTSTRLVEVIIYLLNGPGLAPKKSHILQLGHSGRFAMNIVDDLIVVHHQVIKIQSTIIIIVPDYNPKSLEI